MCIDAAEVFDRQAGREYGFGKYRLGKQPPAKELKLLTTEQLSGLPTNNLEAERHLAGKRVAVAKYRNKNFTAKGIRNDCTLLLSNSLRQQELTKLSYSSALLPTNRDAEVALECNVAEVGTSDDMNRNDDDTFQMDHLVRVKKGNNLTWKHPRKPDTIDLHSASILDCDVDGEWNVSNNRFNTF
ncbi:unnamed protein product [Lepeophtheirus salmonis]|uniref:(salmon louse) hypothetical protein n=1 Tax=Lepeophtheirus salmonis TaxID=72036 RepID=A0A7R8CP40_LEPSM|nr:unnamed protein product [Lepeophtheirus salmonis]CAF2882356.1 unnamed protein product [Lepeophtheirus salmonis]